MKNICRTSKCERVNICPYNNDDRIYCPGYKKESNVEKSAWTKFKKLGDEYGSKFDLALCKYLHIEDLTMAVFKLLWDNNEQEALNIMNDIEKTLIMNELKKTIKEKE